MSNHALFFSGHMSRHNQRQAAQLRPLKLSFNAFGYADSSVLIELGNTKVLCSVTLTDYTPPFLRDKKTGWLSAEYAMLPSATHQRTAREAVMQKRNARSIEISRLIGRAFRSVVDLKRLGEQRTIQIDCDVLQADGGTRVAAITGTSLALRLAEQRWLNLQLLKAPIITTTLAAVSVALVRDQVVLDPDYQEDSAATVDFNFVLTQDDQLVELQGTAEAAPLSWPQFAEFKDLAQAGVQQLFTQLEIDFQALVTTETATLHTPIQFQIPKKLRQHVGD